MSLLRTVFIACQFFVMASFLASSTVAQDKNVTASGQMGTKGVWTLHIELSTAEFEALEPAAPQGLAFGGPTSPIRKASGEPKRETVPNLFGTQFPWVQGILNRTIGQSQATAGGQKCRLRYDGDFTYMMTAASPKRPMFLELLEGEPIEGSRRFRLHTMQFDPTMLRERVAAHVFAKMNVPVSRVIHAEVELVVGEQEPRRIGLYAALEAVDTEFLTRSEIPAMSLMMQINGLNSIQYIGDEWAAYAPLFRTTRVPTKQEQDRIIAFAKLIGEASDDEFKSTINEFIDTSALLRYVAGNSLTSNLTGFSSIGANDYLCLAPDGKFHVITSEMDVAMSGAVLAGAPDQLVNLSLTHPYAGECKLVDRLMKEAKMKDEPNSLAKITGNTASGNMLGIQLGDLGLGSDICATVTGNVANNTTFQGLLVQGNSFTGTIGLAGKGNTFNNSSGDGLGSGQGVFVNLSERPGLAQGVGGLFKGDIIANNTNQNASAGIVLSATSLAGNVTQNTANQNRDSGIVVSAPFVNTQTPTAAISNNTASRNSRDGIEIVRPGTPGGTVGGLIQSNTTSNNSRHGLSISGHQLVSATIGSDATATTTTGGNTATSNTGHGIFIDNFDQMTGTLSGNMATRNQGNGIFVSRFNQMLGALSNNTASNNSLSGISLSGTSLGGVLPTADPAQVLLQANTTNSNGNNGLLVQTRVINGTLIDNIAQQNSLEGVKLVLSGLASTQAETSSIFLTQTMLSGNNLVELAAFPNRILNREFVLENLGAGLVNITFNGNTSANVVSLEPTDREFNFDLRNTFTVGGVETGTGRVNPMSQLNNTGTPKRIFGSSDDSVIVLFAN